MALRFTNNFNLHASSKGKLSPLFLFEPRFVFESPCSIDDALQEDAAVLKAFKNRETARISALHFDGAPNAETPDILFRLQSGHVLTVTPSSYPKHVEDAPDLRVSSSVFGLWSNVCILDGEWCGRTTYVRFWHPRRGWRIATVAKFAISKNPVFHESDAGLCALLSKEII